MFTWRFALAAVVLTVLLFGLGYGGMRSVYQDGFRLWSLTGDENLENTNLHDSNYIFLPRTYTVRRGWPPGSIPIYAGPDNDPHVVGRVVMLRSMPQKWRCLRHMNMFVDIYAEEIRGDQRRMNRLESKPMYIIKTSSENHPIFDLHQEYMYICKVARNYVQMNSVRLLVSDTVGVDAKVKSGLRLEVLPIWKSDSLEWSTIERSPGVKLKGVVPFEMLLVHRLVVLDSNE